MGATGCVAVKNPPANKPYVHETTVDLKSDKLSAEELALYEEQIVQYLDDSLRVNSRSVVGFTQRLNPPVFDSASIFRSLGFMTGFLNSQGFYNSWLDTFTVDYKDVQGRRRLLGGSSYPTTRVKTHFILQMGNHLRVDSVWYTMPTAEMQRLADSAQTGAILKKDVRYNKNVVGAELDRLATLYRNNGFFKMGRAALHAEVDTTDPSLVRFDLDPIEIQLAALRRLEDPTAKVRIHDRPGADPTAFIKYRVDSIIIYPEADFNQSAEEIISDRYQQLTARPNGRVLLRERYGLFQEKFVFRNNFLFPNRYYDEQAYFRTLNSYSQLGPWQTVDVRTFTSVVDSVGHLNIHVLLYPQKKHSLQFDLEGSQNTNISNVLSGRFFAVGAGITARNRNFLRQGIQAVFSIRGALELNNDNIRKRGGLFQSLNLNANQTFSIPRLVWPLNFLDNRQLDFRRTNINLGAFYTNRFAFFEQTNLNANLQWEARKGRNTYMVGFPVFETIYLRGTDSLRHVIDANPALQLSFRPGNIFSFRWSFDRQMGYPNPRHFGALMISNEVTLPGDFRLFNRDFFKFIRFESHFIHHIKFARHSYDFRLYGGLGWSLDKSAGRSMPFFRQFVAGGSNSMRAWQLRQLGPGSSLSSDTARFTDRFGDIHLEFNAEYRRRIARMFGYYLEGAIFADVGNIWNHYNLADGQGKFEFKNLGRDIAIATGLGFRWDLNFLVVRLDGGYKLKDPVRGNNGWPEGLKWRSPNRLGILDRRNVALQIGIGYPF